LADQAGAWDSTYHAPALVREVVEALPGASTVLDGTLGGGGHSAALLAAGVRVDGVDRDPDAVATALERLSAAAGAGLFRAFVANFSALDLVPELVDLRYDGVLLDLGVSSHQLDDPSRGFSFRRGEPLDMRMGAGLGRRLRDQTDSLHDGTAAALLNTAAETELTAIFRDFADEPRAGRLARTIAHRRARGLLTTSDDFVDAIRAALGPRSGPSDFARLFQAVRIAVNDEISALEKALPSLRDRLNPQGRLAVISYHSGEDRVVKRAFRAWSVACRCPPRQPICSCGGRAIGVSITRRPIVPGAEELARNARVRSAKLRVWERAT
jgi:16S rRNA (cytosine1402-N4)-methyltransferase